MAHTPEDIWAEMRLHMEWSDGFSLCVLFSPGASATKLLAQWADDAWAWRTASMTRLNPTQAQGAAQAVLDGLHQHQQQWGKLRAPVWVEMLSHDPVHGPASWEVERAALMALLNESREWLLRAFACPLVLCLPTAWALRVPTLAPDLWHVRSFTAEVAAQPSPTPVQTIWGTQPSLPPPLDHRDTPALEALRQAVQAARQRATDAARQNPAALREWVLALWDLSEHSLQAMQLAEAHAAAVDSLGICRQLRQQLGDSPHVLRDLSVSLNKLGDAEREAGRGEAALSAYREGLEIRRQLHQTLGDSPQVLRDLSVSLIKVGDAESQAGRGEAALSAYRESLEIRRQLRQTLGDGPQVLRDLSVSLERIGNAESEAGRGEAALSAYREGLEIRRQLRQTLGDGPQVLRDLSVSLLKVGDAESQAGRGEAALSAYRESLEIDRQLRQTLGDSPQVLDDLAVSLERCGASAFCTVPERQALLTEAVRLRQQLVAALSSHFHRQRLTVAEQLLRQLADPTAAPVGDGPPNPSTNL
ncbi:MAG: hypothetical protein RLZZ352_894 [Pseudomonadota bacterium]|jgi:tetratricopeptide (TPR) repeat protein